MTTATQKTIFLFTIGSIVVFIAFQNCTNVRLIAPQSTLEIISPTPPEATPPPGTNPVEPTTSLEFPPNYSPIGDIGTIVDQPGFNCPALFRPGWWPGIRGTRCLFQMDASKFYTVRFTAPAYAAAVAAHQAFMGNLGQAGVFFAISEQAPNTPGASTPTICTLKRDRQFVNWSLQDNPVTAGRSDVCFLKPNVDYYLTFADMHVVDNTLAVCAGNPAHDGSIELCLFNLQISSDQIVVDEGYSAPATCRYQPNDPVFARTTVAGGWTRTPGMPVDSRGALMSVSVRVKPDQDFGFINVITRGYLTSDTYMVNVYGGLSGGESWDLSAKNLAPGQAESYVALKFRTPRFGTNIGFSGASKGSGTIWAFVTGQSNYIGLFENFSECPGDVSAATQGEGFDLLVASGYNVLQANGHYGTQDTYRCTPAGDCSTRARDRNSVKYLKPNSIYYLNYYVGDDPLLCNPWSAADGGPSDRCNISTQGIASQGGILFYPADQR